MIIVDGFNDAIGLGNLGVPALGIMSNRMTDAQGEKIAPFAKQLGINRVNLMFDCEATGVDGAKEALWFFAERRFDVRLVWSPGTYGGEFKRDIPIRRLRRISTPCSRPDTELGELSPKTKPASACRTEVRREHSGPWRFGETVTRKPTDEGAN